MLSGNSSVMMHALRKGAKSVFQRQSGGSVTAIAVSDNGSYQAIATTAGSIDLNMRLQLTGDVYTKTITGSKTGPYSLSFSTDNKYLASAADDGFVRVTRLEDFKTVAREPFANYLHAPVIFTAGNSSVFIATDENTVARTLVTGSFWLAENRTYKTENPLITYTELKANSKTRSDISAAAVSFLVVLTNDQRLIFFDTETEEELGFIPRLSKSEIADFAFSQDGEELLIGYEDGTILRIDSTEYYRPKDFKIEVLYASYYSNVTRGGTGPAIFAHDENGLIPFGYVLPPDSFFDYADISGAVSKMGVLSDNWAVPYNVGLHLQGNMIHSINTSPVYIGFGLRGELAIPHTDFRYNYKYEDGTVIQAPYLISAIVPFIGGYQVKIGSGSFVFGELFGGPGIRMLWSPGVANGKIFFSGMAGILVGIQFNGFKVALEASHDTRSGLAVSAVAGVRLSLHEKE